MDVAPPNSFRSDLWHACRTGFRSNLVPGLILQVFALGLLAAYTWVGPVRTGLENLGALKAAGGLWFSAAATAVFGGLIPFLILLSRGSIKKQFRWQSGMYYVLYFAWVGVVVDILYTAQDKWFGSGTDFQTLATKVLIDQGPFNLIYATPVCIIMFRWKDHDFNWTRTFQKLNAREWWLSYWSIQCSAWMVWIPAVTIVYSLPPSLQIPMFNLVLCFFVLVVTLVAKDTES